jgi:hypothetical protein
VFAFEVATADADEACAPEVEACGNIFMRPTLDAPDFAACVAADDPTGNSLLT